MIIPEEESSQNDLIPVKNQFQYCSEEEKIEFESKKTKKKPEGKSKPRQKQIGRKSRGKASAKTLKKKN